MASPEFSDYIDLTIYDEEPQDIYNGSITYAQSALPEFIPRTGTVEDAIMQAVSYSTSLLMGAINRLPNGLMEGILKVMGFNRREATFATGSALFNVFDTSGITIAAGTVIAYQLVEEDTITSYSFETDSDLVIPETFDSGTVTITATTAGLYPQLFDGQSLVLISSAIGVVDLELSGNLSIGSESETDIEYFNRGTQYLASLNGTLATAPQMRNYIISNYANVPFFKVYDLTDGTDTPPLLFADAAAPGCVTIAMCSETGEPLSSTVVNEVIADMEEKSVAGLQVTAIDMVPETVLVNVDISVSSGFLPSTISNDVDIALSDYLSFDNFISRSDNIIYANELVSVAALVPGVKFVKSLTIVSFAGTGTIDANGDLTLLAKGEAPIGSIEVTVL
jgi:hypothetical protein